MSGLDTRWQQRLDALRAEGRDRHLGVPAGIDFSSNDYLGYARRQWPAASESRSGAASRLLRGHHALWDEVESTLAAWHGVERALVFTSGYSANEGLLSTVIEPGDFVASDAGNHASLIDGIRLSKAERFVYRHNDLDHLEDGLRASVRGGERFIVTESLFGMDGDRAPLDEIATLAERYGAHLIVDEAHATGCFGATGGGLVDALGLRPRILASVHTGGKALGVPGAYVAGSNRLRELLINRCRHFIFTTALPPAIASWWLQTLSLVRGDHAGRGRLRAAVQTFHTALGADLTDDYIVPIVLGSDTHAVQAAAILQRAGFDIRAIRPPTVAPGTARLRISLHADHDPATLTRLAAAVAPLLATAAAP